MPIQIKKSFYGYGGEQIFPNPYYDEETIDFQAYY